MVVSEVDLRDVDFGVLIEVAKAVDCYSLLDVDLSRGITEEVRAGVSALLESGELKLEDIELARKESCRGEFAGLTGCFYVMSKGRITSIRMYGRKLKIGDKGKTQFKEGHIKAQGDFDSGQEVKIIGFRFPFRNNSVDNIVIVENKEGRQIAIKLWEFIDYKHDDCR